MYNRTTRRKVIFVAAATLFANAGTMAQPVIPGATGFGIDTPAGRGGDVIRVTNLNDSGEGSLRACVSASGPRICVFEISGTISLDTSLTVTNPRLTIAGQTAPAPGIMLRGADLKIHASDVLVQHIAMRVGDAKEGPSFDARDSLKIGSQDTMVRNVVIDHCSVSWGIDENVEVYHSWDNVTISNTIISEPLRDSFHSKGPHGLGVLINARQDDSRLSMIGNLIAHSYGRNPRSNAPEFLLLNNVIYNAGEFETMLFNDGGLTSSSSVVGNIFIKGSDSKDSTKPIRLSGSTDFGTGLLSGTKLYLADNRASCATEDPWSIVDNQSILGRLLIEASNLLAWSGDLEALPTEDVVDHVLASAGTRPGQRNDVDAGVIADVRNGTGRIINCVADDGTARCARNAGGWPELASNTRTLTVPDDPAADDDGDGYTNVEEWLHEMAAVVEGRSASGGSGAPEDAPEPVEAALPKPPQLMD